MDWIKALTSAVRAGMEQFRVIRKRQQRRRQIPSPF